MRVHDMPPIPTDYYVLRSLPKPQEIDADPVNEAVRQEAQRRVDDQAKERQHFSRRYDRRAPPPVPANEHNGEIESGKDLPLMATDRIDLIV